MGISTLRSRKRSISEPWPPRRGTAPTGRTMTTKARRQSVSRSATQPCAVSMAESPPRTEAAVRNQRACGVLSLSRHDGRRADAGRLGSRPAGQAIRRSPGARAVGSRRSPALTKIDQARRQRLRIRLSLINVNDTPPQPGDQPVVGRDPHSKTVPIDPRRHTTTWLRPPDGRSHIPHVDRRTFGPEGHRRNRPSKCWLIRPASPQWRPPACWTAHPNPFSTTSSP